MSLDFLFLSHVNQCLLLSIIGSWSAATADTVPHAAGIRFTPVVMVTKPGKPGAGMVEAGDATGDPEPRLQVTTSPAIRTYPSSASYICVKRSTD